jgi:hypothetical protein
MGLFEIYVAKDAQAVITASCLVLFQSTSTCLSISTTRCVTLLYHLHEGSYQITRQYDSSLLNFAPSSFLQFHPDCDARAIILTLYPRRYCTATLGTINFLDKTPQLNPTYMLNVDSDGIQNLSAGSMVTYPGL